MQENQPKDLKKYQVDPVLEAILQKAKEELDSFEKWLKSTNKTPEEIKEQLQKKKKELLEEIKWKHYFHNKGIPESWDIWHNVSQTFEDARTKNEQLSSELIDAGISHPHHLVALETAKSQKLTIEQLAYVFIRELPMWNFNEIIEAQKTKGMTDDDIKKAEEYAKQFKEKLEMGKLNPSEDGLLEIRNPNF